ncbi:MAG: hypothetical protein ACR2OW_12420, partial [Methyloligellaceae bacterium]
MPQLEVQVANSLDDAEERVSSGKIDLDSSDLELIEASAEQIVGIRFNNIDIPQGAIITNAYLQFQADETQSGGTSLTLHGEDTDNAQQFSSQTNNISSRQNTTASVNWQPGAWDTVGESGADQQTPDLSAIIQEIVDRSGWAPQNSLALKITGSGKRTAESFDGDQAGAPLLHIEWELPNGGAPTVSISATNDAA